MSRLAILFLDFTGQSADRQRLAQSGRDCPDSYTALVPFNLGFQTVTRLAPQESRIAGAHPIAEGSLVASVQNSGEFFFEPILLGETSEEV